MTKRLVIPFLAVAALVSFAAGYVIAQRVGHAKVSAAIAPVAPAINKMLAGMTEEETKHLLDQIRNFSNFAVAESDQQILFDAVTANRLLAYRERGDESEVWTFLEERLGMFRERYESGDMKIGDKTVLAEAIYKRTLERKN
jgi:hypothetical protein